MAKMITLALLLTCVTLGGSARLKQKAAKLQSISEVEGGGQVCNVVEKTGEGRVQYGFDFSFEKKGGGCSALQCSPYKFFIDVVPSLFKIDPPEPDEDPNMCHCSSSNLKGRSDGDTWQFDFMVHPRVPERKECSEQQCWILYSYALYIAKRSELQSEGKTMSVTDQASRPDHWEVGCVDRKDAAQNKGLPEVGSIIQKLILEGKKGNTVKRNAARDIKRMINVKRTMTAKMANAIKIVQQDSPVQHVAIVEEDKSPSTPDPQEAARVADELLSKLPAKKRPKREEFVEEIRQDLVRENELADEVADIGIGADIIEPENLPSRDNVLMDAVMIQRRGVFCNSIKRDGLTCKNIENEEDCGKAKDLANIDAIGDLKVFNRPQTRYPRSCFVHALYSKGSFYHHVWWNPSTDPERPAVPRTKRSGNKGAAWYLMCGCYKAKEETKVSLPVLKEAVEEVVEFEPVVKPAHMQAASATVLKKQDDEIDIPDQEDLPEGNKDGVITTVAAKETVDLTLLPPETHVESPLANCKAKTDFWAQAACFCSLANDPEYDGDECTAMSKIVIEIAEEGKYEPWICATVRARRSKRSKKTYKKCAAQLSWR